MQRKALAATIEWKAEKTGSFRAIFSTLGVTDHDKDVTLPGAFKNGQAIVISAYQHMSWEGALPPGKGIIGSDDTKAWVDGEFFLNTATGKEHYETVKALGAQQEWSFGYDPVEVSTDSQELAKFAGAERILKGLEVFEVSPVLKGAGIGTATQSIKALKGIARARKVTAQAKSMSADPATAAAVAQLDVVISQVDGLIDVADSLVDSVMAGLGIPDMDELPDTDELAANDGNEPLGDDLINAGLEGNPNLPGKGLTYQVHGATALAAVKAFVARTKALTSLRAKEGRTLSAVNRTRLAALQEAIAVASADLNELLSSTDSTDSGKSAPSDELQKIFLETQKRNAELVGI